MDRTLDRRLARTGTVAASITVLLLVAWFTWINRGAFTNPSDIRVSDPRGAVRDARELIERKRRDTSAFGPFTEPADLPVTLRLPGLRYAKVHDDHLDLVLARNPDVSVGARVWALNHRRHNDTPTSYTDIWFFRYSNELETTSSNIP